MSAIDNTPENRNFLSPLDFQFSIKKAPNVNFFIQKVNIPSIDLKAANTPNPFVSTPYPGEHLTFGMLNITFKVDEDLQNYLELYNWLNALGKPKNFNQYLSIEQQPSYSGNGIYSDISVVALTSRKIPNYEVLYRDAFPVSLSAVEFNTTAVDVNYITASAKFRYTYFTLTQVT